MKTFQRIFILSAALLACQAGHAATVTVDTTTDVVDGSTSDLTALNANKGADGKISLREAIIAANNTAGADTILFSAALNGTPIVLTKTGDDNVAAIGDLDINDSVTITGNGASNTIIQGAANATFAGSIGDKIFGINQDGTHNGLVVTISGVTIRYGKNSIVASGAFTHTGGGVDIFLTGTGNNITFSNCTITDNQCVNGYGGGVNIDSGAPNAGSNHGTVTFTGCTISNNRAQQTGGGINCFADVHNVVLNSCTITGNTTDPGAAANAPGANGGGINIRHTNGGTITGSDPTISNNTAKGPGGGLCVAASGVNNVTFTGTVEATGNVSQSHPAGSSGTGGGIFKDTASSLTLPIVNITGNHADLGTAPSGGGVHFLAGTLSARSGLIGQNTAGSGNSVGNGAGVSVVGGSLDLKFLTILNNTAAVDGGGVWVGDNGVLTLANSTVSGNSAKQNGGGFSFKNPLGTVNASLINVTVANNRADSDNNGSGTGGGISRAGGTVSLGNTLLAGNFRGTGSTADDGAGALTANFSLIETTSGIAVTGANNVLNQAARLGPLADNGGSVLTHALLGGSPAFDTGSVALIPQDTLDLDGDANTTEPLPFDQRGTGFARIKDAADADTVAQVDIGAFEAHPSVQDIVDQSTNEDGAPSVPFNFGDATLPISNIAATSSNPTLIPNANLTLSGSGSSRTLSMTPLANQFGTATITVTVTGSENGVTLNSSDTFVLTVNPIADPPGATPATTAEDTKSTSGLVITKNAVDGPEVANFKITAISNGTLFKHDGVTTIANSDFITVAEGNAGLKFLPAQDKNTAAGDTFGFTVQAALGATDTGISTAVPVSITVTEVNDVPTATNDSLTSIAEDSGTRLITIASLLANDSRGPANESGQSLTITALSSVTGGSAVINSPNVEFTPTLNYNGPATFTYTVQDNGTTAGVADSKTAQATVSFTITPVNDAPVANPDTVVRNANEDIKIKASDLLSNDTDVEHDPLTLTGVNSPSPGGAVVTLSGGWIYYKHNGTASDTFTYTISDGQGGTAVGTVTVAIADPNAQSTAQLSIIVDGTGAHIAFDGIPGRTYTIQFRDNTNDPWQDLGPATDGGLGRFTFSDGAGTLARFYRSVYR